MAILGVDVGGTFTDAVLVEDGRVQTAKVPTIQGVVSFDANGDLADRTVSVFQIKKDTTKPLTDVSAQYKYLEVAPQS